MPRRISAAKSPVLNSAARRAKLRQAKQLDSAANTLDSQAANPIQAFRDGDPDAAVRANAALRKARMLPAQVASDESANLQHRLITGTHNAAADEAAAKRLADAKRLESSLAGAYVDAIAESGRVMTADDMIALMDLTGKRTLRKATINQRFGIEA